MVDINEIRYVVQNCKDQRTIRLIHALCEDHENLIADRDAAESKG